MRMSKVSFFFLFDFLFLFSVSKKLNVLYNYYMLRLSEKTE
jgi:hypothetical protein